MTASTHDSFIDRLNTPEAVSTADMLMRLEGQAQL